MRYSLKSIFRGGAKSLIVPFVLGMLAMFLCTFTAIKGGFQEDLNSVYDDIPVTMHITDITGKRIDDLYVYSTDIEEIEESGFIENSWHSFNLRYMYLGISEYANGEQGTALKEEVIPPEGEFAYETFLNQLNMITSPLVTVSDVNHAPDFYYSGAPEITWIDGFASKDFYTYVEGGEFYCIVSDTFMQENGLSLGDKIRLEGFLNVGNYLIPVTNDFVVAGYYKGEDDKVYIASDLTFGLIFSNTDNNGEDSFKILYNSAGFKIRNTQELSKFKDWLEERFDPHGVAGTYRQWVAIDDGALYSTIDNLTNYINYMNLFYPVVLALIFGIGFFISNILLKSRTGEISVMRYMGQKNTGIFLSFFLEQILLSIPALIISIVLSALIFDGFKAAFMINVIIFAACYYLGTAIALILTLRKVTMQQLKEREE